jgi:hypothetical protein
MKLLGKTTDIATDFVMFEPDNGRPISNEKRTEVKVLYNDDAISFRRNHVRQRAKKIQREITQRICFGVSDHFQFTSMVLMMVNKIIGLC